MTSNTGNLKVMTNDKFKRAFKPSCTIKMEDQVDKFNEFVTVGFNEQTGKCRMVNNADALTLGQAVQMITSEFKESLAQLSEENRELVLKELKLI